MTRGGFIPDPGGSDYWPDWSRPVISGGSATHGVSGEARAPGHRWPIGFHIPKTPKPRITMRLIAEPME